MKGPNLLLGFTTRGRIDLFLLSKYPEMSPQALAIFIEGPTHELQSTSS